jgi:hypothetical protein
MNRFVKTIIKFLLKRSENLDKTFKNTNPNDPMHKRMKSMWEKRERMRLAVEYAENGAPSTRMSDVISKTLEAKQKALKRPPKPKDASKIKKSNRSGSRR